MVGGWGVAVDEARRGLRKKKASKNKSRKAQRGSPRSEIDRRSPTVVICHWRSMIHDSSSIVKATG